MFLRFCPKKATDQSVRLKKQGQLFRFRIVVFSDEKPSLHMWTVWLLVLDVKFFWHQFKN